ncbi:hypothetical protein Goari_011631, partial [Gossypium aridum]|nr:hypothetical protein [Gossypium aridum]
HDNIFAKCDIPVATINGTFDKLDIVGRFNGPELHKLQYPWEIGSPINLSEQIFLTALSVPISMLSGGSLNDEEAKLGLEIKDRLEEFELNPNPKAFVMALWVSRIRDRAANEARRGTKNSG